MIINEVIIKNFGKLANVRYDFTEGMNIVYGENEAGKSTLFAFIRSMLFGMERGRGRASLKDEFTKYEPFDGIGYYAGVLKFEVAGRHFMLSRNFNKTEKKSELICTDDGEVLDPDQGDLEVILEGLTKEVFDSTIAIAQLGIEPNSNLIAKFNNYATSYYMTGDADIDFERTIEILEEKRKQESKEIKIALEKREKKKEALESEMTYIWRDVHQLEEELEGLGEEIEVRKKEKKKKQDVTSTSSFRVHPVELLFILLVTIFAFVVVPKPWGYVSAVVIFLLGIIYVWNRIKVSKNQIKTEPERILETLSKENSPLPLEQLLWKKERVNEELLDKKQAYYNLKEQLQDLDELSDLLIRQEERRKAIEMAKDKLLLLSKNLRKEMESQLNDKIGEIFSEITDDKYEKVFVEEDYSPYLLTKEQKIPLFKLSEGTVQQLYIALRIAISQMLFKEELPFIFDETFIYFDDKRISRILHYLAKSNRQVIIFSCHKREMRILEELGFPYHKILL